MRRSAIALILLGCAATAEPPKAAPVRVVSPTSSPRQAAPGATPAADARRAVARSRAAELEAEVTAFFGESYPPPLPPAPHGRVGSTGWGTWIQPVPRAGALPLGGIRLGGSLPLESSDEVAGHGSCPRFVTVRGGYVCVGGRATLDGDSAWMRAGRWTEPAPGVLPYQYALSVGAPMLTRPVPLDQLPVPLGSRQMKKMRGWSAGHDELATDEPIVPNGPVPEFLRDGGSVPTPWGPPSGLYVKRVPRGSMLAYTRAFEMHGETWVLSTDMSVVPARGLKRFRASGFAGVELGGELELPIAWMRKQPRPKWRHGVRGWERTGETWPVRSFVGLTGSEIADGGRRFLETREAGVYLERADATLVERRPKPPWETKGVGKWIHVKVNRGTLTLYEGPKPVFTTLMSPGKQDATPYGRYFIESKHHVSTMTTEMGEPTQFWIADVPWTVYFKRPYAIHAATWHEDFGERKSGGCVNLSPLDAKRVFDWVEPELPEGWDTVQGYGMGGGTFVLVEG